MEYSDFRRAKEVATREDWSHKLPQYDREADDGAGPSDCATIPAEELDSLSVADDPWEPYSSKDTDHGFDDQEDVIDCEPGEDEVRSQMGSLENIYEHAGAAEVRVQAGELSRGAKYTLSGLPGDVKEISERTVLADLSFLKSGTDRKRTAGIIERIIRIYSSVPGTVQTEPSGKRGVFKFHVSNAYLSPNRGRSPSPKKSHLSPSAPPEPAPLSKKDFLFPELDQGITLHPKFPGLPKCILKYDTHGLTREIISKVASECPDKGFNQILQYSLSQTSKGKRIINMYKLPQ